jgi:hypothetical protein
VLPKFQQDSLVNSTNQIRIFLFSRKEKRMSKKWIILFSVLMVASMLSTSAFTWFPGGFGSQPPKPPLPPQGNYQPYRPSDQFLQAFYWGNHRAGDAEIAFRAVRDYGWGNWSKDWNKIVYRGEEVVLINRCERGFKPPVVKVPRNWRGVKEWVQCVPYKGFAFGPFFKYGYDRF